MKWWKREWKRNKRKKRKCFSSLKSRHERSLATYFTICLRSVSLLLFSADHFHRFDLIRIKFPSRVSFLLTRFLSLLCAPKRWQISKTSPYPSVTFDSFIPVPACHLFLRGLFLSPPLPRQTRLVLVVFVLISGLRTNICLAERNSSLPRGWQPPTRTNGTETYHLAVSEFEWKREMKRNESAPQNWAQHPCSTQSGVPKPPRLSVNRGPETKQNEATPSGPFLSALSVCA